MIPLLALLAPAFILGIVRAAAIDRFGSRTGLTVWTGAAGGMGVAVVGVMALWFLTLVQDYPPGVVPVLLGGVYAGALAFAAHFTRSRLDGDAPGAVGVALGGVIAFLVLTYPMVAWFTNCVAGTGILGFGTCN